MSDYYSKPGISYSMLKLLDENPEKFFRVYIARTEKIPDSPAFKEGRMFDMLLTEPEKFHRIYGINNGAPAFKGDVSIAMYTKLQRMVENINQYKWDIKNQLPLKEILCKGSFQEEIFWTDPCTFIDCKGKLDWISEDKQLIIDFKTTIDSSFPAFDNAIERYKYYLQAAMYCSGIKRKYKLDKFPEYHLLAVSKRDLYNVCAYDCKKYMQTGLEEMRRLLDLYSYYDASNWIEFF